MAQVPGNRGPTVGANAAPNFQQSNPVSADLLSVGSKQAQQFGNALGDAGTSVETIRYQAAEQANALRVDDALNQATERALRLQHDPSEGFTTQKGYDALNRQSGMPLADEYTQKLDQDFQTISSTLGNDRQRQLFNARANNIRTQFLGSAMTYENGQQQEYTLSVRDATVKGAANALVLNADDPINVQQQVTRIRSAIEGGIDPDSKVFVPGAAQMQGKSAAWATEKSQEAVSGAHTQAISSFMEKGNINGAMAYRKQYGKEMTASDMLKIDGTLQKNYDTMQGAAIGNQVVTAARPALNPTTFDRLGNILGVDMGGLTGAVQQAESRGRATDAAGNILEGPMTRQGTAKGDMQVMDATARDPGYGIKPADMTGSRDQQIAELRRVGQQKLAVLVKMYDGDVTKATAAYNWGEKNVDKAVKEAESSRGGGRTWLDYAPKETQSYVANVAKQLNSPNGGKPERPTLEQLQTQVRQTLGPNASPVAVKTALATVEQQFEADNKAITQRKDELVAKGYQELTQNGGRFSDLSPSLRASIYRDAPDKVDELQNFGVRLSKGDDVTDDRLYLRLATNPQTMAKMSDAEFYGLRGGLSQSAFQQFSKQRADLLSGKSSDTAGDLNTGAVSRFADTRLRGIGIDPTPKDGSAESQRVGAIRRFIDSSILDEQRQTGKKFTDAEVQRHVDGLFAQNVQFRETYLGVFNTTQNRQLLSMKPGDVPSADRDRIKSAFAKQGNSNPSEADILGAYFAGQSSKTSKAATNAQDPRTGSF